MMTSSPWEIFCPSAWQAVFFPRSSQHQIHCSNPDMHRISCLSNRLLRHDWHKCFEEHNLMYEILNMLHNSEILALHQTPSTCIAVPPWNLPFPSSFSSCRDKHLVQHYGPYSIFRVLSISRHIIHSLFLCLLTLPWLFTYCMYPVDGSFDMSYQTALLYMKTS